MKLLLIFILLNTVNVILSTMRSLCTVKCGKWIASLMNAVCYGIYTIVIVYTMCELPLWLKALIVALCNLIGVFIVKLIEEIKRKDKIWRIEVTVHNADVPNIVGDLIKANITGYNVIQPVCVNSNDIRILNIYSKNQNQSKEIKEVLKKYNVKYFVTESKIL